MSEIDKRKDDHIRINLEHDVSSRLSTGFEDYHFIHSALPNVNLSEVEARCEFLGHRLEFPILFSSMTGGTDSGDRINRHLVEAANARKVAMAVGSQRAALEQQDSRNATKLRKLAPQIPLYANLGAVQLNYGFTVDECRRAVEVLQADALILHLNPLQEALQVNGQTDFGGLLTKIEKVCQSLEIPVIIKEVGWGISSEIAWHLVEAGASAIDVAGAGGTSWSEVEKHRSTSEADFRIAGHFRDWGIPTAYAIEAIHRRLPEIPLISSGGLKSGVDLAKSIALGATIGGFAGVLLKAATESVDAVINLLDEISMTLRITMFACGAKNIYELAQIPLIRSKSESNG